MEKLGDILSDISQDEIDIILGNHKVDFKELMAVYDEEMKNYMILYPKRKKHDKINCNRTVAKRTRMCLNGQRLFKKLWKVYDKKRFDCMLWNKRIRINNQYKEINVDFPF